MTDALEYLDSHAIDPEVCAAVGVRLEADRLVYPSGKARIFDPGNGPKATQPTGAPIEAWWLREGDPVIICEGEPDALAALSALPATPPPAGLQDLGVLAVPGVEFPPKRLLAALNGAQRAFLLGHGDDSGRKFNRKNGLVLARAGIEVFPVELPEDEDIADYLALRGPEAFANLICDTPRLDPRPGIDGAEWLGQSTDVEAVWGQGYSVLWASGEPFYLVAGPSLGKSTIGQQLALRRVGAVTDDLLGYPVATNQGIVLYLAMDRPRQALRSMRRMVPEYEAIRGRLRVWDRSPPFSISSNPDKLLPWVQSFGDVSAVFIDSLFNIAPRLADEEGAANTNNALQSLVRSDIEVCVIHHDRKRQEGSTPRMDDLFGSRPLSAGAGSIVYLDGEPGTLKAKLLHFKPPVGRISPLEIRQDPGTGDIYCAEDDEPFQGRALREGRGENWSEGVSTFARTMPGGDLSLGDVP